MELNKYAMSVVDGIFREAEQKMVKPLDSTFGEWKGSNYKADIKDLGGFKEVAKWLTSKLADTMEGRAHMRAKAPAEQWTYVWKGIDTLFNGKIAELEKIPKEVKNYLYIQMTIKMARLYYKLITTDTADLNKQIKALLDETKASFEEIKKKLPKK